MKSYFLIKTAGHRNHDDGAPAHIENWLELDWIANNCSVLIS